MLSVPTVAEVVSIVTVLLAEISKVSPTVEPAPPATAGLLDQLAAVFHVLLPLVTHVPSVAHAGRPIKIVRAPVRRIFFMGGMGSGVMTKWTFECVGSQLLFLVLQ